MESGAVNNFHVIEKQINKFDGRRVDEFLEWDSKLRASLSVYNKKNFQRNKTTFNALQVQERPSEFDVDQETTRATWAGDYSRDLGCPKSRPIQRPLLHHSWFSVLHGLKVSGYEQSRLISCLEYKRQHQHQHQHRFHHTSIIITDSIELSLRLALEVSPAAGAIYYQI